MTDSDHLDPAYLRELIDDLRVYQLHKEGESTIDERTAKDVLRILRLMQADAERLEAAERVAKKADDLLEDFKETALANGHAPELPLVTEFPEGKLSYAGPAAKLLTRLRVWRRLSDGQQTVETYEGVTG